MIIMITLMMELVVMKMKLIQNSALEHTLLTLMKIFLDDIIISVGDS